MNNGREPATKQDLLELEHRLEQRFTGIEQQFVGIEQRFVGIEQRFVVMEERFTEALRDMEAKLLRAFYTFAEATQKHLTDLERSDFSIRERLATFEVRLTEVERRLNMPSAGSGQ